ncbi:hypothetical protein YQE_01309, partial [Dendroctonus ponderosae]
MRNFRNFQVKGVLLLRNTKPILHQKMIILKIPSTELFNSQQKNELVSEEAETAITEQTIVVTTARADAIYGVPTVGANEWGSSKNGANFSK